MGRNSRQDDLGKWLMIIIAVIGFIILLAKALFIPVLLLSVVLIFVGLSS